MMLDLDQIILVNNCMLKVINLNRKRCEICSELIIKIPEQRLAYFYSVSIVDLERVNVGIVY